MPKLRFSTSLLVLLFLFSTILPAEASSITDSVVKIFTTANEVDFYRPWQSQGTKSSGGSGGIITGNRILTNAHVVSDHTFIQVKKNNDSRKYTAEVIAINHECDLALLTVKDPEFFQNVTPLKLGDLPQVQDSVSVFGYPQGGDKLSITEGVVSRVELTAYSQSARNLLTVQIDAAINPGNSGGPVVQNGKLVGVAMQVLQSGQNIGYTIPTPVIKHFFKDIEDGKLDGFPILGIDYSTTENSGLRDYYKLGGRKGGVLVTNVLPFSPADGYIKEGDVILEMDGVAIGEDGTFIFRGDERLSLPYLITTKQVNEEMKINILRNGKPEDISLPLREFAALVAHPKHFDKPSYFIYGGLVFTVLSTDLLKSWGGSWWEKAPIDLRHYLMGSGRLNHEKRKELVVLLYVLADDINVGYHQYGNEVIVDVNGQEFSSFKEFVQLLNKIKSTQEYTIVQTEGASAIILRNENIDQINEAILKRNSIPRQYSLDAAQWLGEK